MGLLTKSAIVGFCAGLIAVLFLPRSHHQVAESGKIIVDAEFLSDPGFPIALDAFAKYGKAFALWYAAFEMESVLSKAQKRTGLSKFWTEDEEYWRNGLELLLRSLRENVDRFNGIGVLTAESVIVDALANQLRVQDYLDRHPGVKELQIEGPLVVTGLPRTGSTHLQIALCHSLQFNCLRYFESRAPVAPETLAFQEVGGKKDPRVTNAWRTIYGIHYLRPLFRYMHVSNGGFQC